MERFLQIVTEVNGTVNGWVWGPVMLVFLVGTGIFLTFGRKFFQIGKIGLWMKNTFGIAGSYFATIAIFFSAISTVIGWFIYGSKSCQFLFGKTVTDAYKAIFISIIMIGATMDLSLAWDISDTFNGLMAIPNLIGLLFLSGTVFKVTKNYLARRNGADVAPMYSAYQDVQAEMEAQQDESI